MHRIPQFFVPRQRRKDMDSKRKAGPKLERRLAKKNIDYEPASSSTSSSLSAASEETSSLRTQSLDLAPFGETTSFRLQGIDGEVDLIYRNLGLSPEDFELPTAEWEARKIRSSSDVLPRRGVLLDSPQQVDTAPPQLDNGGGANQLADDFAEVARISDADVGQRDSGQLNDDRLMESDRVRDFNRNRNDSPELVGYPVVVVEPSRGGRGGGIRGVRPPVLAPPPSISLPVIDNTCSPWDIIRSFAPDCDGGSSSVRGFVSSDYDEGASQREEVIGARLGETAVLSGSCSFTTSNDDDSSSTTTEPTSNISPNYRFRSINTGWQKGKLLGRGSFGSVYEGIADDGFFFALKEVSLLDQGDLGRQSIYQLEQEIALLSQFEHENIVQYYGTAKDESNLYIFLELVTQGSLLSLYQKYQLRDSTVSSYTRQILHGLNYLHERNVVHRDIKCANILVGANGLVKLSDFGLAKATKLNDVKSCKGTAFWMAPEVVNLKNQGYGLAADIWSLGCTVLEMSTRRLPYYPLECMQALFRIGRGLPPPLPDSLSGDARDFILKCLEVNPSARPSAAQLLEHPFVRRSLPTSSGSSSPYYFGQQVERFPSV